MRRPELLVATNIPSPYRLHEFRVLARHLASRGVALRVWFMATTERGRAWRYRPGADGFPSRVAVGLSVYPRPDLPLHLTPGLLGRTLTARSRWVLLGGAWYQPATFAPLCLPQRRNRHLLLWNESVRGASEAAGGLRRFAFSRYDGFVVPGERAEAHVRRYSRNPAIRLPNFVDERLYRDRVAALRAGRSGIRRSWSIAEDSVLFAWPARLHPAKGIVPFLSSIRGTAGDFVVAIAGEGPERGAIEAFLAQARTTNVRLLGHLPEDRLLDLYAAADALLLPSAFEPFGFVAVEALWAGLPILISDAAGAAPETVVDGANGWVVDPEDADVSAEAFARAVAFGREGLATMGARSLELAEQRFASDRAAAGFVDRLLEVFPP